MAVALDALRFWPDRSDGGWWGASTTGWGAAPYGRALLTAAEVFVPTRHGIVVYDLASGRDLGLLDEATLPPARRDALPEDVCLYGNLVPVPGRGLLAVNGSVIAYWRKR
jgi:hypothetical protein